MLPIFKKNMMTMCQNNFMYTTFPAEAKPVGGCLKRPGKPLAKKHLEEGMSNKRFCEVKIYFPVGVHSSRKFLATPLNPCFS
jgi:hypothetical protein